MKNHKETGRKATKRTGLRALNRFIALGLLGLALLLLLTPVLASSAQCRRLILAKINDSTAGRTNFAGLSLGWFKGVKVSDFSFDSQDGGLSVLAKQITTKPHYGSILTGKLAFGETVIDEPKVHVTLNEPKQAKTPAGPTPRPGPTGVIPMPVKQFDLVVREGRFKVTDSQARTAELSQINSKLSVRPPGQPVNLTLTATVSDRDKEAMIEASAQAIPGSAGTGWTLKGTTGELTVEVKDLDLESLEPFLALAGIEVQAKGTVSGKLKGQVKDGRLDGLVGSVAGQNMDVTGTPWQGDRLQTKVLDAGVQLKHTKGSIQVEDLQLKTDWAGLQISGIIPTSLKSLDDVLGKEARARLQGSFNCDIAALAAQIPKTLGLKEGLQLASGQLNGQIETRTRGDRPYIQAQAKLAGVKGVIEGKEITLSAPLNAQAQLSSDQGSLSFDKLDVSTSFATINCAGNTEEVKYTADIDFAKLQSELGRFLDLGPYQILGSLNSRGQLVIQEDGITTAGSSEVKHLIINGPNEVTASLPTAVVQHALGVDQKAGLLQIDSLTADTSLGQMNVAQATVALNPAATRPMNLVVNARAVDLAKLQPFAVLFASFPPETQLLGMADSKVNLSSAGDLFKISTDATLIKGFQLLTPGKKPFKQEEISLRADIELNPAEKTSTIKTLQMESDQIKADFAPVSLRMESEQSELQGQAQVEYDWAAVSDIAAAFLPSGLELKGQRTVALDFSSRYPAPDAFLAHLNTSPCTFGFEQANYMGLDFGPTDVNVHVQQGILDMAPFSSVVNEGQLDFSARLDFTRRPMRFSIAQPVAAKGIHVNDTVSRELLVFVNPIFANAVNVSGVADFGAEQLVIPLAGASTKDLQVVGEIAIHNLRLRPAGLLAQIMPLVGARDPTAYLTIHPSRFTVQDGYVRYDDMQVDIGDNPVNFQGAIGADKSLDMTVTLPYTTAGKTVRIGKSRPGKRVALRLTGSVYKPKLDTSKLIEDQVQDLIKDGLDRLFKL